MKSFCEVQLCKEPPLEKEVIDLRIKLQKRFDAENAKVAEEKELALQQKTQSTLMQDLLQQRSITWGANHFEEVMKVTNAIFS